MKKLLLLLLVYITTMNFVNAQNWNWAKEAGGTANGTSGESILTDNNGNIYVAGIFRMASVTFGTYVLTNPSYYNTGYGYGSLFVVKYDASGNVLWAKTANGIIAGIGRIAQDDNGNIIVAGGFLGNLGNNYSIFGRDTLINLNGIYSADIFVVKYNSAGDEIWAKSAGGPGDDEASGVATDDSGSVYVTGAFGTDSLFFSNDTLINANINGNADIFIVKYDSSGNELWAKSYGGFNDDIGRSICTDGNGNVYVTGCSNSVYMYFGSTEIFSTSGEAFILKLDGMGSIIWVKSSHNGSGSNANQATVVDKSGNLYLTSTTNSYDIIFGTDTAKMANTDIDQMYIVKYDSSGNVIWVKNGISPAWDVFPGGIATDNMGSIYLNGWFDGLTLNFGTYTLTAKSAADMFVLKFDTSGTVLWGYNSGGASCYDISADTIGNIYVTGSFYNSMSFGTITLSDPGNSDMFVAKYGPLNVGMIEPVHNEDGITIYPNPSTGKFNLLVNNLQSISKTSTTGITIYNTLGEIVYQSICSGLKSEIDLSSQPQGIYFLQLKSETGSIVKTFVKE